jgi:hypothetical protein
MLDIATAGIARNPTFRLDFESQLDAEFKPRQVEKPAPAPEARVSPHLAKKQRPQVSHDRAASDLKMLISIGYSPETADWIMRQQKLRRAVLETHLHKAWHGKSAYAAMLRKAGVGLNDDQP